MASVARVSFFLLILNSTLTMRLTCGVNFYACSTSKNGRMAKTFCFAFTLACLIRICKKFAEEHALAFGFHLFPVVLLMGWRRQRGPTELGSMRKRLCAR